MNIKTLGPVEHRGPWVKMRVNAVWWFMPVQRYQRFGAVGFTIGCKFRQNIKYILKPGAVEAADFTIRNKYM